jgi:LSD1 subclass zinc finger protein
MSGRYGADQLYYALLFLVLGLILVNMLVDSVILMAVSNAILLLLIFRSFSRNISKRKAENDKFLKIWNPIKREFKLLFRRFKEIGVHRYRKCPHCKKVLQLPIKRGKHMVKCPVCQEKFEVRVIV